MVVGCYVIFRILKNVKDFSNLKILEGCSPEGVKIRPEDDSELFR